MSSSLEELTLLFKSKKKIAILTGAGVSTEAGIPDFQSTDKSWDEELPRVKALSLNYLRKNPDDFWTIYKNVFRKLKDDYKPTSFHKMVADLEKSHEVLVITQNIDGLHQKAGSTNVAEWHGNSNTLKCSKRKCRRLYNFSDFINSTQTPKCECNGVLYPQVVLFGMDVKATYEHQIFIETCDVLICAGTSLDVYPANEIPKIAKERRFNRSENVSIWINRDLPPASYDFDLILQGELSEIVSMLKV